MNILGIDTSCDDTAAAVVADGKKILSNIVASQVDLHQEFGGIVPELASNCLQVPIATLLRGSRFAA